MAARVKAHNHGGQHTAGIFADMSVDGPVIGTLVAIVDRAKNLPNRKTIGKQDPYCAARLGKEAKKTTTDIRGGQTPKWDQELRFTVHDGPDYYQLKVSVFTDDKKTDLIGESWIDLKGIIVPGGGQSDVWQNLTCRGKYAGEIRLEITYYDNRPKPERPPPKSRQPASAEVDSRQRTPVKRRPLPSEPNSVELPASSPAPGPDQYQTPPRAHGRQASHPAFVASQSPLQAMEYNASSPAGPRKPGEHHSPSPQPGPPVQSSTPTRADPSYYSHRSRDQYETPPRHHDDRDRSPRVPFPQYDQPDPRQYSPVPEPYDTGSREDLRQMPPMEDDRPPPPPVHRSRHNSAGPEAAHRSSYDVTPHKATPPMPMRHDVLKQEAHRYTDSYPGRPTFRPYDSAPPLSNSTAHHQHSLTYESTPQRHQSYDSTYDAHPRSMQPTVEDVPESPAEHQYSMVRHSEARNYHPPTAEMSYERDPSPAPLNLSRSPGAGSYYGSPSPAHSPGVYETDARARSVSPMAPHDYAVTASQASYNSYGSGQSQYSNQRNESEVAYTPASASYGVPAIPLSLVPGVDPNISQEISERIYQERRNSGHAMSQSMVPVSRGRQMSEPPQAYTPDPGYATQEMALQTYDRRRPSYSNEMVPVSRPSYSNEIAPISRPRNVSPNPYVSSQSTIRRKSVSPVPPPVEERRASDVPFGPDSYDALNPSVLSSSDGRDPDAKIITYDGREIDPSDHLPMESWAPEPEPKQPSPDPRARPPPQAAQPMPPSGRRQLRIAARPQAPPTHAPSYMDGPQTPPSVQNTGRSRLQKRDRGSVNASPAASSPLAPITPDNYQDRQSPYTPSRGPQRSNTWDYPNENHAPHYASGPPIPAKVPLPIMSGGNGGSNELALMEEMQRIDLGTGRSRRRGGY